MKFRMIMTTRHESRLERPTLDDARAFAAKLEQDLNSLSLEREQTAVTVELLDESAEVAP